jgi:hypothetical protein
VGDSGSHAAVTVSIGESMRQGLSVGSSGVVRGGQQIVPAILLVQLRCGLSVWLSRPHSCPAMPHPSLQGRMWEDSFKEMGLPPSSFGKFAFTDGTPKVPMERGSGAAVL